MEYNKKCFWSELPTPPLSTFINCILHDLFSWPTPAFSWSLSKCCFFGVKRVLNVTPGHVLVGVCGVCVEPVALIDLQCERLLAWRFKCGEMWFWGGDPKQAAACESNPTTTTGWCKHTDWHTDRLCMTVHVVLEKQAETDSLWVYDLKVFTKSCFQIRYDYRKNIFVLGT